MKEKNKQNLIKMDPLVGNCEPIGAINFQKDDEISFSNK
jgi:hypothetical protein